MSEQIGNSVSSIGVFLILLFIVENQYWKIAQEIAKQFIYEAKDIAIERLKQKLGLVERNSTPK